MQATNVSQNTNTDTGLQQATRLHSSTQSVI